MAKKTKAIFRRAADHCAWKYGKKKSLVRACKEGASVAVDEARHEAPSIGRSRTKKRRRPQY